MGRKRSLCAGGARDENPSSMSCPPPTARAPKESGTHAALDWVLASRLASCDRDWIGKQNTLQPDFSPGNAARQRMCRYKLASGVEPLKQINSQWPFLVFRAAERPTGSALRRGRPQTRTAPRGHTEAALHGQRLAVMSATAGSGRRVNRRVGQAAAGPGVRPRRKAAPTVVR